jgi:hypothetical protein
MDWPKILAEEILRDLPSYRFYLAGSKQDQAYLVDWSLPQPELAFVSVK